MGMDYRESNTFKGSFLMPDKTYYTILGLVAGLAGTGLGGVISFLVPVRKKRGMAMLLEFAGGVMLAVTCFDLLPEAFAILPLFPALLAFLAGVLATYLIENIASATASDSRGFARMGLTISIAIALHNLPEGLAIGSGFMRSEALGFSLMLAIMLHDIPEGMSQAIPFRFSGKGLGFIVFVCLLSGLPTGLGALLGVALGGVSQTLIGLCLAFAGGSMTYVVCGDIIPESKALHRGRLPVFASIAGFLAGLLIVMQTR